MSLSHQENSASQFSVAGRLAAGLVAIAAWVGLALFLNEEYKRLGGWPGAVWNNMAYLTDLSNFALAIVMTGVVFGLPKVSKPTVVGWAVAAAATMGVGFALAGGSLSFGTSSAQDILLHGATPIASVFFWLVFVPKGHIRWKHLLVWMAWPIGYWTYGIGRGLLTGKFPYPFMDLSRHSVSFVGSTILLMISIFGAWALVLRMLDSALSSQRLTSRQV